MTIEDLLVEFHAIGHRFWFVQDARVVDQTDVAITLRFRITDQLFVQVFLNQKGGRFNLALINPSGRLYGRDWEHGYWHRHPFAATHLHEATPEGMSSQPLTRFLTEVETILLENALL